MYANDLALLAKAEEEMKVVLKRFVGLCVCREEKVKYRNIESDGEERRKGEEIQMGMGSERNRNS